MNPHLMAMVQALMGGQKPDLQPVAGRGPPPVQILPGKWDVLRDFDRGRNMPGGYGVHELPDGRIHITDDNNQTIRMLMPGVDFK